MPSPRLEYTIAFDLAVAALERERVPQRVVAMLSAPVFVPELLLRSAWPVTVATDNPEVAATVRSWVAAGRSYGPEPVVTSLEAGSALPSESCDAVVWASPAAATWQVQFAQVDRLLRPGGRLCVLGAGWLSTLTRPVRRAWEPGEPSWRLVGPGRLVTKLHERAYHVERLVGLGGPASVGRALAARLAETRGRPDLADRWNAAYRESLVSTGKAALGSSFVLALCRKGPGA